VAKIHVLQNTNLTVFGSGIVLKQPDLYVIVYIQYICVQGVFILIIFVVTTI